MISNKDFCQKPRKARFDYIKKICNQPKILGYYGELGEVQHYIIKFQLNSYPSNVAYSNRGNQTVRNNIIQFWSDNCFGRTTSNKKYTRNMGISTISFLSLVLSTNASASLLKRLLNLPQTQVLRWLLYEFAYDSQIRAFTENHGEI